MLDKLWRQVVVTRMASVLGGNSAASQTVVSKELMCDGRLVSFIKVNKNRLWLLKLCGGKSARKGLLRRARVIERLRSLCGSNDHVKGMDDTPTKAAVPDVNDPMHQLDPTCEHGRDIWHDAVADRACIAQPYEQSLGSRGGRTVVGRIRSVRVGDRWRGPNDLSRRFN